MRLLTTTLLEKPLFHVSLGYDLNENLKLELTGINVFNNNYRAFASFSQIVQISGLLVVNF